MECREEVAHAVVTAEPATPDPSACPVPGRDDSGARAAEDCSAWARGPKAYTPVITAAAASTPPISGRVTRRWLRSVTWRTSRFPDV
ncbi:hypothetical protein Pth03_65680 [Planotetraspora thailandica]|uniref:Uncharacterized protein n=1 Tax=Planotetraspora thailandica TaxID=487172 RepID=A0A8J3XZS5_9ACTN|nr:hypothetical protein Pth03_65680 [Planotetraspora thailandica]